LYSPAWVSPGGASRANDDGKVAKVGRCEVMVVVCSARGGGAMQQRWVGRPRCCTLRGRLFDAVAAETQPVAAVAPVPAPALAAGVVTPPVRAARASPRRVAGRRRWREGGARELIFVVDVLAAEKKRGQRAPTPLTPPPPPAAAAAAADVQVHEAIVQRGSSERAQGAPLKCAT
jgi:hypothetical protein